MEVIDRRHFVVVFYRNSPVVCGAEAFREARLALCVGQDHFLYGVRVQPMQHLRDVYRSGVRKRDQCMTHSPFTVCSTWLTACVDSQHSGENLKF